MKALTLGVLVLMSILRPNGKIALVQHIQDLGGVAYVEEVVDHVWRAAIEEGISPYDLAALLIEESSLRHYKVSRKKCKTIAQLHPLGKYYTAYENACRAVPSQCLYASIRVAAIALHEAQEECGTGPAGFGRYRSRRCLHREREDIAYAKARRLEAFLQ